MRTRFLLSLPVLCLSLQANAQYSSQFRSQASPTEIAEAVCRIQAKEAAAKSFRGCMMTSKQTQKTEGSQVNEPTDQEPTISLQQDRSAARSKKPLKATTAGKAMVFDDSMEAPEPIPGE